MGRTELTVANTGTKDAKVTLENCGEGHPNWVFIDGWKGVKTLKIGDVATIGLHLWVEHAALAERLIRGEVELEHVVVVRVEDGADHFVSVKAQFTSE